MNESKRLISRVIIMIFIILLFIVSSAVVLANLQIVNSAYYIETANRTVATSTPIYAARGEMLDRNGVKLVSNSTAYLIRFEKPLWDNNGQNDMLLEIIDILEKYDTSYFKSLPISLINDNFAFTSNTSDLMSFLSSRAGISKYTTAEEAISYFYTRYLISDTYTKEEALKIITIRYEMDKNNFSTYNSYIFAENIPIDVVVMIEERSKDFPGVYINAESVREYQTSYAAHILGRVGPIFSEEYELLKEQGYQMDATIGKDGMEKALEEYLRETNGKKTADIYINGEVESIGVSSEPVPGNNVVLTIDINLQQVAEESLARTLESIKAEAERTGKDGADTEGGAVVVLDVNTGEVLSLASYPTYSLENFNQDYKEIYENPLSPMFNRAIQGAYAPGSTFKMIPAIAALEEDVIEPYSVIRDLGIYTYYAPSYTPKCWIYRSYGATHGNENVSDAIRDSCNYFFYDIGRQLTAPLLEEYSLMFGLGNKTGIELSGEVSGVIAGPTYRESIGMIWYPGDTLSASIGQSDNLFTPVAIANYIATLANGGTVNQVHLLKSVESADYTETILFNEPEPLNVIELEDENLQAVLNGMENVVNEGGTAASIFRNYPIQVAGKTGSSQVSSGSANGLFVSYAPFDNPEIAVCVVGEHAGSGGNVAIVARDIYDYYFGLYDE